MPYNDAQSFKLNFILFYPFKVSSTKQFNENNYSNQMNKELPI